MNTQYVEKQKVQQLIADLNNNCIKRIDENFEKTAIKKKEKFLVNLLFAY